MHKWSRAAGAVLAAAIAPAAQAGWFDHGDPLVDPFVTVTRFSGAVLSPDGKRLATISPDDKGRPGVEVTDLDANTSWRLAPVNTRSFPAALSLTAQLPRKLTWIDDEQIAVDFWSDFGMVLKAHGGVGSPHYSHYLGALRADGETETAIVVRVTGDGGLKRVVAGSEQLKPLTLGIPGERIQDWRVDASGSARIARSVESHEGADPRLVTWYRKAEGAPWQKLDERSVADEPFVPVAVGDSPDRIVVQARNGGDRMAIWNYDVERHSFLGSVASEPDADLAMRENDPDDGSIAAVEADGLRPRTVWFDPRMARLQAAVDAALPDHVNTLQGGHSRRVVVRSFSDVDPGHLFVLDAETLKMQDLGAIQPGVEPARMQPRQFLHYASFDGLSIPSYLTLPGKPARPVPMVVLIHGGPQARDRWGWDPEVQFLAAHGYAVFQPQFRGSTGFGKHLEEAGYGQWGLGMQDDITAGVHYLIDQRIADPKRICIVGASYGGYAALWGLVKTPELYRCGVSMAGVSDIKRRLTDDSDGSRSDWARAVWKSRIGDPSSMKDTWDSVSPLKHADRIQAPLLLVHGDEDIRVPISHSALMLETMQALRKDVEWIDFPHEGHGIFYVEDERRYLEAVAKLLARTIGKGEPPSAK